MNAIGICQWRKPGFPVGGGRNLVGGVDSRGGYVSKILYVETKESGPRGGGAPGTPPRSDNVCVCVQPLCYWSFVLYERPILDDEHKPHKPGCSGRLPSSVTEA